MHDSFAHFLEDALEHGAGDRNDDSILEKGNRRKKRLGDRCVFRGGTNKAGATWDKEISVHELDPHGHATGKFIPKAVVVPAQIGQAGQTSCLDLIAQVCESDRLSKRAAMTGKQCATEERKRARVHGERVATLAKVEECKAASIQK